MCQALNYFTLEKCKKGHFLIDRWNTVLELQFNKGLHSGFALSRKVICKYTKLWTFYTFDASQYKWDSKNHFQMWSYKTMRCLPAIGMLTVTSSFSGDRLFMVQVAKNSTQIDLIKAVGWVVAERAREWCGEVGSGAGKMLPMAQLSPWGWLSPKVTKFQTSHLHILMLTTRRKKGLFLEYFGMSVAFLFPRNPSKCLLRSLWSRLI